MGIAVDKVQLELATSNTEHRLRTEALEFACTGKVAHANSRVKVLEQTVAALRAAHHQEAQYAAKTSSVHSDPEQYYYGDGGDDDDDDDDVYQDDWLYTRAPHKPTYKVSAGTHTQTHTRTSTASASSAGARGAHDDGGRPPRRPEGPGGRR